MKKKRGADELIRFADYALEYEVRMMLCHAWEFLKNRPDGSLEALPDNRFDALLEAWLVHIRLLDDFLRHGQSKKDAAIARDWHGKWRSDGFLDDEDRAVLNAQLTHLSWKRRRWDSEVRPPWDGQMREWSNACCKEVLRLCDEVPEDLKPGFEWIRSHAEGLLRDGARPTREA